MVDPERAAAARHGAEARTRCRRAARAPGGGDGSGGGGAGGAAAPRSTAPPRKRARTWEHDAVVWVRAAPDPAADSPPRCLRRSRRRADAYALARRRAARRAGASAWWPRTPFFTSGSSDTAANPTRASGSAHRPWRAARCAAPAPCPSPRDAVAAQHPFPIDAFFAALAASPVANVSQSRGGTGAVSDQRGRDARRAFGQRRNGALVRRRQRGMAAARSRPRRRRESGAVRGGRGARAGAGGGDGAGQPRHRRRRPMRPAWSTPGEPWCCRCGRAPRPQRRFPGCWPPDLAPRSTTRRRDGQRRAPASSASSTPAAARRWCCANSSTAPALGYDGDGVGRGIRSVMKEVRTAAFAYACSVDLSRAHLEALLQA